MKRIVLSVCAGFAAAVVAQGEDLQGLVAYWPFTDGFADASGGGNNLTGFNVTTSDGFARFELVDDGKTWAQTSSQVVLSPYDAVTYSLWVRRIVDHGADIIFEQTEKSNLTGRGGAAKVTWKDEDHFAATINNTSSKTALRTTSAINCSDVVWHHVVAVYDKTASHPDNVTLYVDGEKNSILDSANAAETKDVAFCNGIFYLSRRAGSAGDSKGVACDMDDVRIYGAHKSASAVKALYYGGLSLVYNNDETKYAHLLPEGVTSRDGTAMCRLRLGSESLQLSFNGAPAQAGNRELALPVGTVCTLVAVGTVGDVAWTGLPADAVVDPTTRMARFVIADPLTVAAELTSGELVAHWPFEGEDGLADASGNGYTLSANGMSTTDGFARFAKAADGKVWAQTTKALSLSPYGTVSYSLWIRNLDPSAGDIIFEVSPKGNATGRWGAPRVVYKKDRSEPYFAAVNLMKGNSIHYSSGVLCEGNDWHQLTVVYKRNAKNPENVRIYVDGKLDSTPDANEHADAEDIPFLDDILYLARRAGSSGTAAGLAGDMDEFKVFGEVMSTVDIAREYYLGLQKVYQDDPEKPASLLPDGCRLQNGQIQLRVRLSSNTPASINGQEAQTGVQEHWVALGSACSAEVAVPVNGGRIGWKGVPEFVAFGEQDARATFTVVEPMSVVVDAFTPTHVWTGAASTDFASAANWTNATADAAVAAPGVGDDVYIPAGCARQPTAATPFSVRSFRIGRLAGESGTATFTANTVQTNVVSGDVVVYAGGVLTHTGPENVPTKKLNLLVGGDMAVHADGRLDVRGKGYNHKQWPGSGLSQNGGRHASSHGSAICPVTHGGGGGKDQDGRGSGVVYANVSGTLTIDGEITADYYVDNPFCGSGGSIQLHAGSYAGKGFVTANGAKGTGSDSADGGRIALYVGVDGDEFAGTVTAYGGGPDATRPGACGTVYRCREGERGHLLLDAEGRKYVKVTPLADFVFGGSDFRLASLTVTNGASAALKEGMTLRVTELWDTRGGTMAFEANSHVVFEPSATGRVHGVNAFWDVSCAATGKALAFGTGAGEVTSVQDGGSCDFHGAADAALALLPDGEGVWSIGVSKLAACVLDYLAVSNSDASAGMSLTARSSADLGGNNYWSFPQPILPGDVIEWTGASSGDWSDPANWKDKYNQPRTPEGTDHVIIPSECANSPTVNAAMLTLNSVTVSNGAHLVLQSSSVTVTNALTVNGALGVSGGGILTCCGNVLFAKASSLDVDASSVLSLAGDFEQAVSAPGVAFSSLRVQKTGGLVMFAKGFSAQELRANVSTAPVQLLFGAGEAFAVRDLFLMGELGGAAGLTLSSSESGAAWYLNATGIRHVSAVSVSDSDASGGKVIAADALSEGPDARNVNWTFSGSSKFWTGAVDTAFENGANWSPVGAPDADANVLVTPAGGESLTLSITKPTHVASFTLVSEDGTVKLDVSAAVNVTGETKIGGDVTVTMKTEDLWTTGGDFSLEDGAVFTHDGPLNPPKYRAGISAGGSITIAAGAHVTADGKGRVPKSAYWGTIWNTGSHGGKAEQRCYGSVFQPVLHGSCGGNQNTGHYAYGGGVVRLIAEGDVTVAGEVSANGLYDSFSGAGGSIWITCGGALKGGGIIRAIGGMYATSNQSYCGAGGRISVMQGAKVREFGGLLSARACLAGDGAASGGGAGTVYFSCGGQPLAGDLLLSNNGYAVLATQLPMADDGDSTRVYRGVSVTVTNGAVLELTGSLTVKDVDLAHAKSRIDLGTNTLTIISHDHKNGKHWANGAKVTCTTNAATGVYGKIVWKPCGFALIVR